MVLQQHSAIGTHYILYRHRKEGGGATVGAKTLMGGGIAFKNHQLIITFALSVDSLVAFHTTNESIY